MASELVASLGPSDFQRESALGNDASVQLLTPYVTPLGTNAGTLRGLALGKYKTSANSLAKGYITAFRIPLSLTMGTGLTFKIYLTDDGENAADLGLVVQVGVVVKRINANATTVIDTGDATEQTLNVTLSSTAGGTAIGSLAIANANLNSAAVGDLVMVRVRRIGNNASDTCTGRAILWRVEVQNT